MNTERKLRSRLNEVGMLAQNILVIAFIMLLFGSGLQMIFPDRDANEKWKTGIFPVGALIEEAKYAFLIGGLLALSLEFASRRAQMQTLKDHMDQVIDKMDKGVDSIIKASNLTNFHRELGGPNTPYLVHVLGNKIYDRYIEGLSSLKTGFQIDSGDWAIEATRIFYSELPKVDLRDVRRDESRLEVRVTHLGVPNEWGTTEAMLSLTTQKLAYASGNFEITRIFCFERRDLQIQSSLQTIKDVIRHMEDCEVRVLIYIKRYNSFMRDYTWVPSLNVFMEWNINAGKRSVLIKSDVDEHDDLASKWNELKSSASPPATIWERLRHEGLISE